MQPWLTIMIQSTVAMSCVTLAYAALSPLLTKRYAAKWSYMGWLLIAVGWIIPFRPPLDLFIGAAHRIDISARVMQSLNHDLLAMDASGLEAIRESIPLWVVLLAIWGLGVACSVAYHALRHRRFMRFVGRWSEPVVDPRVWEILIRVQAELGMQRQIGVKVCEALPSPMLVGLLRPMIVLPTIQVPEHTLTLIMKHELIHLKRHDLWSKAVLVAVTCLYWYNPLVYLMARAAADQCEISCDERLLQDADGQLRMQYGEAIIGAARRRGRAYTPLSTNFYGGKKSMRLRISSIMDVTRKRNGAAILGVTLAGIILTGGIVVSAGSAQQQEAIPATTVGSDNEYSRPSDEVVQRKALLIRLLTGPATATPNPAGDGATMSVDESAGVGDGIVSNEVHRFKEALQNAYPGNK
ncbi:putative peptidase, M56 family protein [Paenibacillus sp. 598K]|uniref:M56 family metallopeptidase n=1 Tax=Paenibacillus sp. 598K TaxID=1117987 RepID=UPI000FFA01F4|nr:M56 family metallopeptidase [Paenibacillus sp. 598K]GBF73421.1 putative peptidase, M56 family protein [Paenibacillus sp. 598K]